MCDLRVAKGGFRAADGAPSRGGAVRFPDSAIFLSMRVIAGEVKGRRLKSPGPETRPLTDRAREALFSILGGYVRGAEVLDLYGGSGSLSCEALSRGAARTTVVEHSSSVLSVARENLEHCDFIDRAELVCVDVRTFLKRSRAGDSAFDLVFIDPPYVVTDEAIFNLLSGLSARLAGGAVVILHRRAQRHNDGHHFVWPNGYRSYDDRVYGSTALHFAQFVGE